MVSPLPTFCNASSRLPGATVTPSLKTLSALVTVRVAACEIGARRPSARARHECLKIIRTGLVECVTGGYRKTPKKQAFNPRALAGSTLGAHPTALVPQLAANRATTLTG